MTRRIIIGLLLGLGSVSCHAGTALGALLSDSISVSGDSISRAYDANIAACNYGDNVSRNWATGKTHGTSYCSAGAEGTFSHAERLECAKGAAVTIFNDAKSGGTMLGDFRSQAATIRAHLSPAPAPRYALVLMGHNDACTSTLTKTGNSCSGDQAPDNYCRTTNAAFEREFRAGLDQLIQIPSARILVLATLRVSELCNLGSKSACGQGSGFACQLVWSFTGSICASLTTDCSDQRRIDMYNTLLAYNAILARVTAEYAAIPAGATSATGAVKATDVVLKYTAGTFDFTFSSDDLSCCDCFHPADLGQAKLAQFAWDGFQCSPGTPCCATTGDALTDAKCAALDTTSFHPGGFWPGNVACGNGIIDPGEQCDDGNTLDGDCCSSTCQTAAPDGSSCDDGNACTDNDTCMSGSCGGSSAVSCTALDQCHAPGTCDPTTGLCSNPLQDDGTGCDDGNACTAADHCVAGICTGDLQTCGNGIVDTQCDETCDDGAGNGTDSCCSATCQLVDGDGDGVCDRDDPCTTPAVATRARIVIRHLTTPVGDDTLTFRGRAILPFPLEPPLDPRARGIRVILNDQHGTLLDVSLPGGDYVFPPGLGWKSRGDTSWTYINRTATRPGGISRVVIRNRSMRTPGLLSFTVQGTAGTYPVSAAALPLSGLIILDPPTATAGQCSEATFPGPKPTPRCTLSTTGSVLTCR